jgi:hypothetical protein
VLISADNNLADTVGMELPGKTLMFEVNPTQLEESKPSIQ